MADSAKKSFLSRPITNKNRVPEMIQKIAAAKAEGKFTFQAGRMDRVVNLGIGIAAVCALGAAGVGLHKLAYNYGKKEGA